MSVCHIGLTKCNVFNCPTQNLFDTCLTQHVDDRARTVKTSHLWTYVVDGAFTQHVSHCGKTGHHTDTAQIYLLTAVFRNLRLCTLILLLSCHLCSTYVYAIFGFRRLLCKTCVDVHVDTTETRTSAHNRGGLSQSRVL